MKLFLIALALFLGATTSHAISATRAHVRAGDPVDDTLVKLCEGDHKTTGYGSIRYKAIVSPSAAALPPVARDATTGSAGCPPGAKTESCRVPDRTVVAKVVELLVKMKSMTNCASPELNTLHTRYTTAPPAELPFWCV